MQVKVTNRESGVVILERNSGQEPGCYYYDQSQIGIMNPGIEYEIYVRFQDRYCRNYLNVWIDWNIDGDFYDRNIFTSPMVNENVKNVFNTVMSASNCVWEDRTIVKVPEDITDGPNYSLTEGKTRMRVMTNYAYNGSPCCLGSCCFDTYSNSYMNWGYGEYEDYILQFQGGLKDTYPSDGDILFAGEDYDGTWRDHDGDGTDTYFKKPAFLFTSDQKQGTKCTYYIEGPKPATTVVYRALEKYPSTDTEIHIGGSGKEYAIQHAAEKYAYPKSPYSTGIFNADRGGEYLVVSQQVGKPRQLRKKFTVSWNNDLAVANIISPRTNGDPHFFKYVRGQSIKVTGLFMNVGLYNIDEFYGIARIWDPDGELVYRDSVYFSAPPRDVLKGGNENKYDDIEMDFRNARFTRTGVYTIQIDCNLLGTNDPNYAGDQDDYNDHMRREDEEAYPFEVAYEIQLQSDQIIRPSLDSIMMVNRPVVPWVVFKNVGIGDASDVPATLIVWNSAGDEVYRSDVIVEDVPAGKYNTKHKFFEPMVISEPGEYRACVWLTATEDPVRSDDTLCTTFTIDDGLRGTYTVGKLYEGQNRNFPTIDSVMNDLYFRGITGSCVFELTDASYTLESNLDIGGPAWDFRSRIIGLGPDDETGQTNSITWKAHRTRANTRGGVTINLESINGMGLAFGQTVMPSNPYAVMGEFGTVTNANSPGFIGFDGGKQKAIRMILKSTNPAFGACVYMDNGSHNITIKSCIIENATPALSQRTWLPLILFDPTLGFQFQANTTGSGSSQDGYSAGIASRNTLLRFEDADFLRLDTVQSSNNVIDNNDISGFGYGIVSLGLGPLFLQNQALYKRFYNAGNQYTNNIIHDVYRAGILLGYEESSDIMYNRIYNVGSAEGYGIMAGGNSRGDVDGYNTVNLTIAGNEISGVSGTQLAQGIRVEQVRKTFQDPAGGEIHFPNIEENTKVQNNVLWGITGGADANISGISLFTQRNEMLGNMWDIITTPAKAAYYTRGDKVSNNTVIISDDGGVQNRGSVAGISVQNAVTPEICNNAILFRDGSYAAGSPCVSAILYQGPKPEDGGLVSDCNAYCLGTSGGSIYRFIETDMNSEILEAGDRNEFATLNQWQLWTGQDNNSVTGNFWNDLAFTGNAPYELRMIDMPEGSILDNRGERLSYVTKDIDGNSRGAAGQKYDIGAFEFTGSMYVSDVEMLNIPSPGAYRSGSNAFNDAEYIMTEAPVEVTARLRNNGSLQQSDINVYVKIYRESIDGGYLETPEVEEVIKTSVASTQSIQVNFKLNDGAGEEFVPQTFAELENDGEYYDIPYLFSTMSANVTPKYKIEVSVESDQHNANNILEKEVRFYLKKSELSLLVSSENSMRNIYSSSASAPDAPGADEIAGQLNYDSLMTGLHGLGWFTDATVDRYNLDLFERKGWEPRSVNYTMYRSMFWTDGNDSKGTDKGLTRYERMDIEEFLAPTEQEAKKNLIIGSQEMVRELLEPGTISNYDPEFVGDILRAYSVSPHNPMGAGVSNDGNHVCGVSVGRDLIEEIKATGFTDVEYTDQSGSTYTLNDVAPYCALMGIDPEGDGWARSAYFYMDHRGCPTDSIMGVATTSLTRNLVLLGVDWRHWGNTDRVLRSVLDFCDKNGNPIVPIELGAFTATASGKRVDLAWTTLSEHNSARFEVERADYSEAGRSEYRKIDEVAAQGESAGRHDYATSDYNVEYGNSYVYRLNMVDLDGQSKHSGEKVVTIGDGGILWIGEAMPNPASEESVFELKVGDSRDVTIQVYDMSGKPVMTLLSGRQESGTSKLRVNVRELASGTYTVVLHSGEVTLTRSLRVVK